MIIADEISGDFREAIEEAIEISDLMDSMEAQMNGKEVDVCFAALTILLSHLFMEYTDDAAGACSVAQAFHKDVLESIEATYLAGQSTH